MFTTFVYCWYFFWGGGIMYKYYPILNHVTKKKLPLIFSYMYYTDQKIDHLRLKNLHFFKGRMIFFPKYLPILNFLNTDLFLSVFFLGKKYHKKCFICCKCRRPQDDKLQVNLSNSTVWSEQFEIWHFSWAYNFRTTALHSFRQVLNK